MAAYRFSSWSRWDIPAPGTVAGPLPSQRLFEQVPANRSTAAQLVHPVYIEKYVNSLDPSFYDCIYSVDNSVTTIIERCYKEIGCCATGCCKNTDWQTKYGWAVALICLFCVFVIVAVTCWMTVWLVNRSKDKRQKKLLIQASSVSPATSQMSLAYPIPNGYYGTGPFQSPPLTHGYRY